MKKIACALLFALICVGTYGMPAFTAPQFDNLLELTVKRNKYPIKNRLEFVTKNHPTVRCSIEINDSNFGDGVPDWRSTPSLSIHPMMSTDEKYILLGERERNGNKWDIWDGYVAIKDIQDCDLDKIMVYTGSDLFDVNEKA